MQLHVFLGDLETSPKSTLHALQNQIGCFNHKMVTVVAGKLKSRWFYIANCIRQPERRASQTSTDHASLKEVTPARIKEYAIITIVLQIW